MSLEGVLAGIFNSNKDKSAGIKVLMQEKIGESFRLDWFESFEFGQEFEEVCIDWSTKIAPLLRINFKNNLSFELLSFLLPFIVCTVKQQHHHQQLQQLQQQQLDQRLSLFSDLLDEGQITRLHNNH